MTQTYFPFDSGQGANLQEHQWSKMARHWLGTGVIKGLLDELETYADSTGMQVKVKTGQAWIQGHYFESDEEEVLSISASDPTNPRIDRVIVRLDWTANTIELAILQGTSAVVPIAPSLTQNTSRWEISLAQVWVESSASTISGSAITDERTFGTDVYLQSGERDKILNALQGLGQKVQTGIVDIPDTSSINLNVTFNEAFSEAPIVFLTLRSISGNYKDYYVANETATGFTIAFDSPFTATSGRRFWWIAIGN